MATPAGGDTFSPGIVARVSGALKVLSGRATLQAPQDFFGPNAPLPPAAPDSVKGRPWDFPVGVNLQYQPRLDQGSDTIDFATLRRVADPVQGGLDLLRIAIETRKDQMEAQPWCIKGRDGKDGGQRARDIEKAMRKPDLVHTYRQWARPFWDDLLVIDAPAMYFRPRPKGQFIPEVVDGALIKILVDGNGRTPLPPDAAYQQIIKGLPAVDYSLGELLYAPRNVRSYRFYGMSPVEQVLGIANIALKRQLHLLSYYTEGNIPDAILLPPADWNPDQIKAAQGWLDTLTDSSVKRKVRIMPGGTFTQMRDPKLKDELDDWLARIICYCFSLAPGALVKDMTKATAGTNAQTAHEEGLEPFKLWWKDVMDEVIARCFGADDLEFAYADEEVVDANEKMTIWTGYKAAGIVTADEVRDLALGMEPMSQEQKDEVAPPPPPALVAPGMGSGKPGANGSGTTLGAGDGSASPLPPAKTKKNAQSEGLQKKKTEILKPIDRDRAAAKKCVAAVQKLMTARFAKQRKAMVKAVKDDAAKLMKMDPQDYADLWDDIAKADQDATRKKLEKALTPMATDGAKQGLSQVLAVVPVDPDRDVDAMLSQANEQAIAFAQGRAAELVGMRWDDDAGEWITNPNPEWAIDGTTRDNIQSLTTQAMEEGWSNDDLAQRIQDDEGFSDARAEMIARTETAFADVHGNMDAYEASGLVDATEWVVGAGECDICEENAAAGPVAMGEAFPSGDDMPPAHPNCRCDVLPVVNTAPEEE